MCVAVWLRGSLGARSRDSACKTRKFTAATIVSCRNSRHLHTCQRQARNHHLLTLLRMDVEGRGVIFGLQLLFTRLQMAAWHRVAAFGQHCGLGWSCGAKFWGLKAKLPSSARNDGEQGQKTFFSDLGVCLPRLVQKLRLSVFFGFSAGRFDQPCRRGTGGERGGNGGGNGGERGRTGRFWGLAWGSAVLEATVPNFCKKNKTPQKIHGSCPASRKIFKLPRIPRNVFKTRQKARKTPKCHHLMRTRWNRGNFQPKHPNTNIFE